MAKYERIIFWSEDDKCWIVDVPELPGCMADGATPAEALENVEKMISEWLETAKEIGRDIPEPKVRFVPETEPLPDEIEAILEAKADTSPTISHDEINWD